MAVTEAFAYGAGAGPIPDEIEVLDAGADRDLARGAAVATGRSTLRCDYSASHITGRHWAEPARVAGNVVARWQRPEL